MARKQRRGNRRVRPPLTRTGRAGQAPNQPAPLSSDFGAYAGAIRRRRNA